MDLLHYLPVIENFPKPGIFFRDISPLLANADAFKSAIESLDTLSKEFDYTHILGIESRGFIFGAALANHAHKGLLLARKPNKLPLAITKKIRNASFVLVYRITPLYSLDQ